MKDVLLWEEGGYLKTGLDFETATRTAESNLCFLF